MSLMKKIATIREALSGLDVCTYHYTAGSDAGRRYIVWAELMEGSILSANNKKSESEITGYADYFTDEEYDPMIDMIDEALNNAEGCIATIESVQFGDPTSSNDNLIHYTWRWSVI